jgi:hypothetical protein
MQAGAMPATTIKKGETEVKNYKKPAVVQTKKKVACSTQSKK